MSKLLWGQVYFKDQYCGVLRQEPGNRFSFTYDNSYLENPLGAISVTLPLQEEAHVCQNGLHPFFDNLVAEGWLESAQSKLLLKHHTSRFERLLAFGNDCAGAISIIDPEPEQLSKDMLNPEDAKEIAAFTARASLSGVQPKLAMIKEASGLRPARISELSTHIAKFSSRGHEDLVFNEYLTSRALHALLPDDSVANISVITLEGFAEPALIVERFDRQQGKRLHFEEFNQLLNHASAAKYEGGYQDMARFMDHCEACPPLEKLKLYKRILAGLLLGNTDMHFKNFALQYTNTGSLELTPSYDQVAACLYDYKTIALSLGKASNIYLGKLKARTLIDLGVEFGLSKSIISMSVSNIENHLDAAKQAIADAPHGSSPLKNQLITTLEKRWNGSFALIGKTLCKKQ